MRKYMTRHMTAVILTAVLAVVVLVVAAVKARAQVAYPVYGGYPVRAYGYTQPVIPPYYRGNYYQSYYQNNNYGYQPVYFYGGGYGYYGGYSNGSLGGPQLYAPSWAPHGRFYGGW